MIAEPMHLLTRRKLLQAAAALPLIDRLDAQSARPFPGRIDMRLVSAGIQVGGGILESLLHGTPPAGTDCTNWLGMTAAAICQLRTFGDFDAIVSSPQAGRQAFDLSPLVIAAARHYAVTPEMIRIFGELSADPLGVYEAARGAGGFDNMASLMCGVPQHYLDAWVPGLNPDLKSQELCDPLFPGDPCYIVTECDPFGPFCVPDPLPGIPNPFSGVILPWADPANPKAPVPKRGMSKADVCFWAQQAAEYFVMAGTYYGTAQQVASRLGLPVIVTLAGEVVIESAFLPDVVLFLAVTGAIIYTVKKVACPL